MPTSFLTDGGVPVVGFDGRPMLVDAQSAFALMCGAVATVEVTGEQAPYPVTATAVFERVGLCWVFDSGSWVPWGDVDPVALTAGELYQWEGAWDVSLTDVDGTLPLGPGSLCGNVSLPAVYTLVVPDEYTMTITLEAAP